MTSGVKSMPAGPRIDRAWIAATTLVVALLGPPAGVSAQNSCPSIAPQQALGGVRWYSDAANSVVDPEKQKQNEAAMKPVRDLLRIVADAADHGLDSAVPGDAACARANLGSWAAAGALLKRPTWSVPMAEQTIAVVGLNLAALKFERAGQPLPSEVRTWISEATSVIVATYEANKFRSNLYVWSGVAAASNDVLMGTKRYTSYTTRVWRESVAKIRPDGYVDDELARKGRALIYHNYLRGALTLLNSLRLQLGEIVAPAELASLERLDRAVNTNVCDSAPIAALAGASQEAFGRWETSIGTYFAEAGKNPDWQRCTRTPAGFSGPTYGGRFDLTSRMLDQMSRR